MRRVLWILAIVLAMLVTTTRVVAAPVPEVERAVLGHHTVQVGETLFCIGRAYQVDPWAIALENAIVNVNVIHPGDELTVPDVPVSLPPGHTCTPQFGDTPSPPPSSPVCGACTCHQQHVIATGQTLYRIAGLYGVDVQALAACNCLANPSYIKIGDSLCVP
jgi:LysM repeat protein